MKILILYATYSGGTEMASTALAESLSQKGYEVTKKDVSETTAEEIAAHEFIVLGSPSWGEGQPHDYFLELPKRLPGEFLKGKKVAIFGLGDSSFPLFCGAVTHLQEIAVKAGGVVEQPLLKIDNYFINQTDANTQLEEWIAKIIDA